MNPLGQPIAGPSRQRYSSNSPPPPSVFEEFQAYPFTDDLDFKAGLPTVIAAIRGTKRTASQIDEMIGRAQWFYFTRMKGLSISWEAYAHYSTTSTPALLPTSSPSRQSTPRSSRSKDPLATLNNLAESRRMMSDTGILGGVAGEGDTGMSFAMLCRLISEGRAGEVGGVREIPDQLNEAPPSQPTLPLRPKPWEQPQPLDQTTSPPIYQIPGSSTGYLNPTSFNHPTGLTYTGLGSMSPPPPPLTHATSSSSTVSQRSNPSSATSSEWQGQTPGSGQSY